MVGGENQEMIQEGDGIRGLEIKNRASVLGKQCGDWWEECGLKRGEQWMKPVS